MPTPAYVPLTLDSVLQQKKGAVSAVVDDEVAIMCVEQGSYFTLNEVGSRIWMMLERPRSLHDVCKTLLAEYEVEEDVCRTDVLNLARDMESRNLVERSHESGK